MKSYRQLWFQTGDLGYIGVTVALKALNACCIMTQLLEETSQFTLRKPRSPLKINGERGFLRVKRLTIYNSGTRNGGQVPLYYPVTHKPVVQPPLRTGHMTWPVDKSITTVISWSPILSLVNKIRDDLQLEWCDMPNNGTHCVLAILDRW